VSGIFKSFGDAPDDLKEEIKEFTMLWEQNTLPRFFSPCVWDILMKVQKGKKILLLKLVSNTPQLISMYLYLFSASKVPNPLENTLRFLLTFNFGDKYETY
jgi:hypothetical protein